MAQGKATGYDGKSAGGKAEPENKGEHLRNPIVPIVPVQLLRRWEKNHENDYSIYTNLANIPDEIVKFLLCAFDVKHEEIKDDEDSGDLLVAKIATCFKNGSFDELHNKAASKWQNAEFRQSYTNALISAMSGKDLVAADIFIILATIPVDLELLTPVQKSDIAVVYTDAYKTCVLNSSLDTSLDTTLDPTMVDADTERYLLQRSILASLIARTGNKFLQNDPRYTFVTLDVGAALGGARARYEHLAAEKKRKNKNTTLTNKEEKSLKKDVQSTCGFLGDAVDILKYPLHPIVLNDCMDAAIKGHKGWDYAQFVDAQKIEIAPGLLANELVKLNILPTEIIKMIVPYYYLFHARNVKNANNAIDYATKNPGSPALEQVASQPEIPTLFAFTQRDIGLLDHSRNKTGIVIDKDPGKHCIYIAKASGEMNKDNLNRFLADKIIGGTRLNFLKGDEDKVTVPNPHNPNKPLIITRKDLTFGSSHISFKGGDGPLMEGIVKDLEAAQKAIAKALDAAKATKDTAKALTKDAAKAGRGR